MRAPLLLRAAAAALASALIAPGAARAQTLLLPGLPPEDRLLAPVQQPAQRPQLAQAPQPNRLALPSSQTPRPTRPGAREIPPPPIEQRHPRAVDVLYQPNRFYLVDRARMLWFSPGARLHVDGVFFFGDDILAGRRTAAGTYQRADVENTVLIRRTRLEAWAGALQRYTIGVATEFGLPSPVQNDVPAPTAVPQLQFAIFNAAIHPLLNLSAGQMNAPLTLENRSSTNTLDAPERSLLARSLVVPQVREIGLMAWGERADRLFEYYLGVFTGDGPNRTNRDIDWDIIARVVLRPLVNVSTVFSGLHLGASGRLGLRGAAVDYAYPSMATPGGYRFFSAAHGSPASPVTVVPDAEHFAIAGECDLPVRRFDLRGEIAYVSYGTREMPAAPSDAPRLSGDALRLGRLHGWGFYLQAFYWLWGEVGTNGRAGTTQRPPAFAPEGRPSRLAAPQGVQALLRLEAIDFYYDADARGSTAPPSDVVDRAGRYTVWGIGGGINYWATPHVRLTAYYEHYFMGVLPPNGTLGFDDNHALGPRNARGPTPSFGELILRAATQF